MSTDRYIDATEALGNRTTAQAQLAGDLKVGMVVTAKTAADTDGSVLRVAAQVPVETCIRELSVFNDAISGLSSVSAGIYASGVGGAAISSALFASAIDLSAGNPVTGAAKSLLSAVAIANRNMTIRDLYNTLNASTPLAAKFVDIALTFTTGGTNTGNIAVLTTGWVQ